MNTLNRAARLLAAGAAASFTIALFSTVVSIAEPARSALIAKSAAEQKSMAARAVVQVAQAR